MVHLSLNKRYATKAIDIAHIKQEPLFLWQHPVFIQRRPLHSWKKHLKNSGIAAKYQWCCYPYSLGDFLSLLKNLSQKNTQKRIEHFWSISPNSRVKKLKKPHCLCIHTYLVLFVKEASSECFPLSFCKNFKENFKKNLKRVFAWMEVIGNLWYKWSSNTFVERDVIQLILKRLNLFWNASKIKSFRKSMWILIFSAQVFALFRYSFGFDMSSLNFLHIYHTI